MRTSRTLADQSSRRIRQNVAMQLSELVDACTRACAAGARPDKVDVLAGLFRDRPAIEVGMAATLLLRTDLFDTPPGVDATERHPRAASLRAAAQQTAAGGDDDDDEPTMADVVDALAAIDAAPTDTVRQVLRDQLVHRARPAHRAWITTVTEHATVDPTTFGVVASAVARTARVPVGRLRRAATLCGSLPLAIRIALERGTEGLDAVALEPGRPVPLTRIEGEEPIDATQKLTEPHLIEWHPGTDRIQVHRTRGVVTVFDDRLRDVTDAASGVVDQVATFPRDDLVLDGWAQLDRQVSEPGGEWTRRTHAARAVFSDVLFDGAPVVDEPLAVRRRLLTTIVPDDARTPEYDPDDLRSVISATRRVSANPGSELLLKAADAPYEGGLVRSTWRRIAEGPIAVLAAVAAERGTGAKSHLLASVHLAAAGGGELVTVGRTSRMVSDEMVLAQTGAFAEIALDGEHDDVFHLRPELVAVTAIDGAEHDDSSPGGVRATRPRVLGYLRRAEADLTTVGELRKLCPSSAVAPSDISNTPVDGVPAPPTLPPPPATATPAGDDSFSLSVATAPTAPHQRAKGVDLDFAPYREPPLLEASRPWSFVLASRLIAAAWSLAALGAAYIVRTADDRTGDQIDVLGLVAAAVAVLIGVAGWAWSDQVVRNLQRLDGRRPNRTRCVTAWLTPLVVSGALAVSVVPLEPTEPADIRPLIIGVAFALTMWRPYALIRRILTTLTRERSDPLIVSAYIVDVLAFGLVWWRFTVWPSDDSELTDGVVDTMFASAAAVALLLMSAAVLWIQLLRTVRRALAYRRSSQATRYEHRMLRLRGIDVRDPDVWWALVQRRAEERRIKERAESGADRPVVRPGVTVDELVALTRREHSVAFRRLDESESDELERRLRAEFATILDQGEPLDARQRETPGDPTGVPSLPGRRSADAGGARDDAFARQLETLIQRAGSAQVDAAIDEHRRRLDDDPGSVRTAPPRLVPVEFVRLLMGLTFAAMTLACGWLSVVALRAGQTDTGTGMSATAVDRLELARRVMWLAAVAGCVLVTLWVSTTIRPARRAGAPVPNAHRIDAFVVVGAGLGGAAIYLEQADPGRWTVLALLPLAWSAIAGGLSLEPTRTWFHLPTAPLISWLVMLPAIALVAFLGGLVSDIEPSDAPQRLAFAGILLTLGSARITALSVLTALDIEDELRGSPELAVPVRNNAPRRAHPNR